MVAHLRTSARKKWRAYRNQSELFGAPSSRLTYPAWVLHDTLRWGRLGRYIALSRCIPGWTRGEEAVALAWASASLPQVAVIVEIGSFLGRSAVLLAGARKLRGSGQVHCIDPFDASGDTFSASVYQAIEGSLDSPLRHCFDQNIRRAGLTDWVVVHPGYAHDIAAHWHQPVDMLFMDGDQSYASVRQTYESWAPWLKPGGVLAVHNSRPGKYQAGHDGHRRLIVETVHPPEYTEVQLIGTTTFARKSLK